MSTAPGTPDHFAREDCRHYLRRSSHNGDAVERCRLGAASELPFRCPDGCLFFEERKLYTTGWAREGDQAMTNTAWSLADLPPARPRPSGQAGGGRAGGGRPGNGKNKKKRRGR